MPASEPLLGAGVLAAVGLGSAYLRWATREERRAEALAAQHKDDEIEYLRGEVKNCRAESEVMRGQLAATQIRLGMLIGFAKREGWELPDELLH